MIALALLFALAQAAGPQSHGRLFPPQDLGLLESPDRDEWQQPDRIMDALAIADGATVADIGAGAGWFTIILARRVGPNGTVYAEDVQRQMLEAIRRRVSREGLLNVQGLLGTSTDPRLPERAIDAILVVDMYSEVDVDDRVAFLRNLARALKSNGRIGIVNYKPGQGGPGPSPTEGVRVESTAVEAASTMSQRGAVTSSIDDTGSRPVKRYWLWASAGDNCSDAPTHCSSSGCDLSGCRPQKLPNHCH